MGMEAIHVRHRTHKCDCDITVTPYEQYHLLSHNPLKTQSHSEKIQIVHTMRL